MCVQRGRDFGARYVGDIFGQFCFYMLLTLCRHCILCSSQGGLRYIMHIFLGCFGAFCIYFNHVTIRTLRSSTVLCFGVTVCLASRALDYCMIFLGASTVILVLDRNSRLYMSLLFFWGSRLIKNSDSGSLLTPCLTFITLRTMCPAFPRSAFTSLGGIEWCKCRITILYARSSFSW